MAKPHSHKLGDSNVSNVTNDGKHSHRLPGGGVTSSDVGGSSHIHTFNGANTGGPTDALIQSVDDLRDIEKDFPRKAAIRKDNNIKRQN